MREGGTLMKYDGLFLNKTLDLPGLDSS
jgi:hypothetical protein